MKIKFIVQVVAVFVLILISPTSTQTATAELTTCHTEPIGAVHFSSESAHLWESQKVKLKKLAVEISNSSCTIAYVRGYTAKFFWNHDSHKFRMELSKARALAAHLFLQKQLDRLGSTIELRASWFAGRHPTATNQTAVGRAKNRRAVISLLSIDEN